MNSACYHGHGRKPPFFEGWYYKLVDAAEDQKCVIIPGISMGRDVSSRHAFIQVLDGRTGDAAYHEYSLAGFEAARGVFDLRIGRNHFTPDGLSVDIRGA
jgi:hypothetical protein